MESVPDKLRVLGTGFGRQLPSHGRGHWFNPSRAHHFTPVFLRLSFAIHNIGFDLWTLFWFGILGFLMRSFGFPLAPMILGVVLGNIAELNLARAFAITSDLTPFVTRPWSLLFFILAIFSAFFPVYQRDRLTKRWILGYSPCMAMAVSVPVFLMGGLVRPFLGFVLLGVGGYLIWRRAKNRWQLPKPL